MDELNRDLLTQEEIDALLAEVEASSGAPDMLDLAERQAILEVMEAVGGAVLELLGGPAAGADPDLSVLQAADLRDAMAGGGLLVDIQRPASIRFIALAEPAAETPADEALDACAARVTDAVSRVVGAAAGVRVHRSEAADPVETWDIAGDAPLAVCWWADGGSDGRRGLAAPLAMLRRLLEVPAEVELEDPDPPVTGAGHVDAAQVDYPELGDVAQQVVRANIDLLFDVPLEVTAVLGSTRRQVGEVLSMGPGSVLELDKLAGEPVEVLVNGKLIARGEVVVIDEHFGVRITDIVSRAERLRQLR